MQKTFGKYCAIARIDAGFTQESAVPVLLISDRSISAYERGETMPPADIVARMMDKYAAPWLGYQYLRCNDVGQVLLPDVPIGRNLSASILSLRVEMEDVINSQKLLDKVGVDDVITEKELQSFERCRKELMDLLGAAIPIITAQKTPVLIHRRN